MKYTQEQKDLLLDRLFDGVVFFNIYDTIRITHINNKKSWYNPKTSLFWLSYSNIWHFFENENIYNFQEIKYLIEPILRDTTERKELTTNAWMDIARCCLKRKELTKQ